MLTTRLQVFCLSRSSSHTFRDRTDRAAKYDSAPLSTTLGPFYSSLPSPSPLSASQIDLIARIVPSVSWSTETKLRASGGWGEWHDACAELHCVQDADRLDAVGAVGIMRCAAFSGAKGRVLLDGRDGDDSAEGHFADKLLKIRDRMKTACGKEEAERRHATVRPSEPHVAFRRRGRWLARAPGHVQRPGTWESQHR